MPCGLRPNTDTAEAAGTGGAPSIAQCDGVGSRAPLALRVAGRTVRFVPAYALPQPTALSRIRPNAEVSQAPRKRFGVVPPTATLSSTNGWLLVAGEWQ